MVRVGGVGGLGRLGSGTRTGPVSYVTVVGAHLRDWIGRDLDHRQRRVFEVPRVLICWPYMVISAAFPDVHCWNAETEVRGGKTLILDQTMEMFGHLGGKAVVGVWIMG